MIHPLNPGVRRTGAGARILVNELVSVHDLKLEYFRRKVIDNKCPEGSY